MELYNGITIVGTGNVAWHLATSFSKAGIRINKIIGRNLIRAKELADYISTTCTDNIAFIPEKTDLILLCVSDDAIEQLVFDLQDVDNPVAHTAASISISVFQKKKARGVFYPFQTFTKNIRMGEIEIPVFIEGTDVETFRLLENLGKAISLSVLPLNSEQRKILHIAGIMVNNFSNYFYARAFDYLESNEIKTAFLLPLIRETIHKLDSGRPQDLQTGPAMRGNNEIIKKHQQLIRDNELRELYRLLSESIMEYYTK